ncbi:nucleic acid-binding, OB-fold protein [Tanacetum coccineum]
MATTTEADSQRKDKGKMILTEPSITSIADLCSTDCNKTIEAIVYRKWLSKHYETRLPTKFCCILLDKQGTPIQANMDPEDTEYFDKLLRLGKAYRMSAYNELAARANVRSAVLTARANVRSAVLTDYIGCIRAISGIDTFGNATSQRKLRRLIHIENLSGNIIGLALWNEMATGFDMDYYTSLPQPVVIAVSSCYVSRYNGLQLSATYATHYYLNPDIPETHHIIEQSKLRKNKKSFPVSNTPGSGPTKLPAIASKQLSVTEQLQFQSHASVTKPTH